MRIRLLISFLLLFSFCVEIEEQLSRDEKLLLEFSKEIARAPYYDFPPSSCFSEENYLRLYEKIAKLNKLALELQKGGVEISTEIKNEGIFDRIKKFLGFYDEKRVEEAVIKYNEWVEIHNSISREDFLKAFEGISEKYALKNFSGFISVGDITYSKLEYDFSKAPEIERVEKLRRDLYPEEEPACVLKYTFLNKTHLLGRYPCYIYGFLLSSFYPIYPSFIFLFKTESNKYFVKREILAKEIGKIKFEDDLSHYSSLFHSLCSYLEAAKDYKERKEKEGFKLLEKVEREEEELESEKTFFNSSVVKEALLLVVKSKEITAEPEMDYRKKIKEARELLYSKGRLGERILNTYKAIRMLKEAEAYIERCKTSLYTNFEAMKAACKLYREKANLSIFCDYTSISDVEKLAENLIFAYSKYMEKEKKEREAYDNLKVIVEKKFDELEKFFERASKFLPLEVSISFDKKIKEIGMKIKISSNCDELFEILNEMGEVREEICYELILSSYPKALKMKEKAEKIFMLSSSLNLNFSFPPFISYELSPKSQICLNLINILEFERTLRIYEEELNIYREEIASNVPVNINCSIPLLGAEFYATCLLTAENPWPDILKKASSSIILPYPAGKIDSRAIVGGDIGNVESLVGIGRNLRIKWKNLGEGAIILIKFKAKLPAATVEKINESSRPGFYSVTYKIKGNCPSYAYAIIEHPFKMHLMNSSLDYRIFNETHIALLIPCNREVFVTFSGVPYRIEKNGSKIFVERIVNTTLPIFLEFDELKGKNFSFTLSDKKVVLLRDRKMLFEGKLEGNERDEKEKITFEEEEVRSYGEVKLRERIEGARDKILGCIPSHIVKEVRKRYYMPRARCVYVNYSKARRYFERKDYEKAREEMEREEGKEKAYLSLALKYKKEAEISIGQLRSLINNPISRKIAGRYLEEAERAYKEGDYIKALYFAKYGIIKAPVNLETPLRIILALLIVFGAFIFSRRREEEELI